MKHGYKHGEAGIFKNSKMWKLGLLGLLAALVMGLCGCSAADFSLPSNIDLAPGQTYPLLQAARYQGQEPDAATVTAALAALEGSENFSLDFTSSAPGVVRVDESGLLTAKAPGMAVVRVRCDALDATYEVAVTVVALPDSLSIDQTLALPVGQAQPLNTQIGYAGYGTEAGGAVRYTSLDETIAVVDPSGVVRGVATGETAVVASVEGTSLTATCAVSVGDAVQSVVLSRAALALEQGERMVLAAAVQPQPMGENTPALQWQSSDPAVATVTQDGYVTALAAGAVDITATAGDKTAACRLTVTAPATPESATPEAATPESATPEAATPEAAPEAATPEAAPEAAPEIPAEGLQEEQAEPLLWSEATPESATPEDATPESATPESAAPVPATPESATPESATPESAVPVPATPESATAGSSTPEDATAESATPEDATPETATIEERLEKLNDLANGVGEKLRSALERMFTWAPPDGGAGGQAE
ncbi:MAG: Ig-like domain-containing protein [Gemmiger sp.]|nr:Ig-like domain-containing protein [Gemmiger sp.]